jgi:CDP-glucose 4,6-dehydratase
MTGHTGFTGSWASIWLDKIGAHVFGYALPPETQPNLWDEAKLDSRIRGEIGDIRDFEHLFASMNEFQPDLVLHLAAQPLVRRSFLIPRETFDINTQGTVNVLEAAKTISSVKAVLCITTDKVYKNLESDHRYTESDDLGGKDPYSASKAAAELAISSFRFSNSRSPSPWISVARGGNIIGGGDWSEDRLIPDYIRAHVSGQPMKVRNMAATRPWQHVLALVEGYFIIMAGLLSDDPETFARAFNLGPIEDNVLSVGEVLRKLNEQIEGVRVESQQSKLPEANKLSLDSSFAKKVFGWNPTWQTAEAIRNTAIWYKSHLAQEKSAYELCVEQIDSWKASASQN